jgi:septal ring factor EnvC (AmiA/AmiB activator)
LVEWFEWQIENNMSADIMAEYMMALNDNEKARHAWGEETKDLKDQLRKLDQEDQKLLADQIEETAKAQAQIENWKHLAEAQQDRGDKLHEINREIYGQMKGMESTIATQAQTILELKARLFDLLDK